MAPNSNNSPLSKDNQANYSDGAELYMSPIERRNSPRRYDRLGIEDSDLVTDNRDLVEYVLEHNSL